MEGMPTGIGTGGYSVLKVRVRHSGVTESLPYEFALSTMILFPNSHGYFWLHRFSIAVPAY